MSGRPQAEVAGLAKPGWLARFKGLVIWLLARLLLLTVRIRVRGGERLQRLRRQGPVVYAFWHGRQLALFGAIPERPLVVVASRSRDGQLQEIVCRHFGLEVVRGSSSRGGWAALVGLTRHLRREHSVALAVDGPRGPLHRAKPGAITLAALTGCPLIPVAAGANRKVVLRSAWDAFQIPLPFARVEVEFGEPLHLQRRDAHRAEQLAGVLTARIEQLCRRVDERVQRR